MNKMDKKRALKDVGIRLRKVRETLGFSHTKMASYFGKVRSSYTKNEIGDTFPNVITLQALASAFDISLDWLIGSKGPMYFKEKGTAAEKIGMKGDTLLEDVKDLLEHMDRIPRLRYEILGSFHKFKEENKELVASSIGKTEE